MKDNKLSLTEKWSIDTEQHQEQKRIMAFSCKAKDLTKKIEEAAKKIKN